MKRHRRQRHKPDFHFALVPFIDILTILVVFLLTHTSETDVLPNTKNIKIPESIATIKPRPTVVVMVTKDDLLVNGKAVVRVQDIVSSSEAVIGPLKTALMNQAGRLLAEESKEDIAAREVTILGDRNVPYSVLRKVMATCTEAEYGKVSLAVIQSERSTVARTASLKS